MTIVSMAVKGRIYPNREQAEKLASMRYLLACIRERVKAEAREYYERNGEGCPGGWLQKEIAQPMHRKLGMPCDALSVVNVVQTHFQTLLNWWRRPDHFGPPQRRAPERYPANIYVHNQRFQVDGNRVRLMGNKVGWMRWKAGREITGKINSGRISRVGDKWYLSVSVEQPAPEYAPPSSFAVGVDPGIRATTAVTDTDVFDVVRETAKRHRRRMKRLDRKIARCKRGSVRHRRLKARRAMLMRAEADRRRDRQHKFSRRVVEGSAVVGIESPSAKSWQESKLFGEAFAEAAPGEIARQIRYKAGWACRELVEVPESEASTQTCYVCGEKTKHKLGLRKFTCSSCGHRDGRDINSARNVRAKAMMGARAVRPEAALNGRPKCAGNGERFSPVRRAVLPDDPAHPCPANSQRSQTALQPVVRQHVTVGAVAMAKLL